MCVVVEQPVFVSSLQSLNELLASGSKDVGKAAVEKQVRRGGNTGAFETSPKERPDPTPFPPTPARRLQVQEVNAQLQKEKDAEIQARQAARGGEQASGGGGGGGGGKGWNEDDLQLLIKAVNLFPAGTNAR